MRELYNQTYNFFQENHKILCDNYPGITVKRLHQEIEQYLLQLAGNPLPLNGLAPDKLSLKPESSYVESFYKHVLEGTPLAYINGKTFFYKSEFYCKPGVFIPRFETEILVAEVSKVIKSIDCPSKIIEIGTGSGAVILSILQECTNDKNIHAYATDISDIALSLAEQNYFLHKQQIPSNIQLEFIKCDRLNNPLLQNNEGQFKIIISNPPYIKFPDDFNDVHPQVNSFEPHQALYLKNGQYNKWFEEFFIDANKLLCHDGIFVMEGHEKYLPDLKAIALHCGFQKGEIIQDLCAKNRFLKIWKK